MVDSTPSATVTRDVGLWFADERSFATWYEDAMPRVYGYLLRRTGDADLAEELTQEAFLAAFRKRRSFRGEADPATWAVAIARRLLADEFRRRDRRERGWLGARVREIVPGSDPGIEPGTEPDPHAIVDATADLFAAVRALPPLQRAAVILCYIDGLPMREAAALIGKSVGATESLLSRARVRLRGTLTEDDRGR